MGENYVGPPCDYMPADGVPEWLADKREADGIVAAPEVSRSWYDRESHDPLTRDVAFNRHSMNDGEHISPTDNHQVNVGTDNIRVALVQGIDEEAFRRTLSAAVRATVGLDMTQGDALEAHGDWEEMLKGGLQTALETQVIVFAVSGVSRTATHQLVRSRRAAFHQQSQRAGYMGDAPECRMPESIWLDDIARKEFLQSVMQSWRAYRRICERDISYQDARFVLPEGTTNFILLEYPVREFLNVYAYRACSMFQWEIVSVMRKCREVLISEHPWLEPYVKISCEKTGPITIRRDKGLGFEEDEPLSHHCTFQGWEDVEGQCAFPWAKHEARTFKPTFHRIGRRQPDGSVK